MHKDQFWKPPKHVRSALNRGDNLYREYRKRISEELDRERKIRLAMRERYE